MSGPLFEPKHIGDDLFAPDPRVELSEREDGADSVSPTGTGTAKAKRRQKSKGQASRPRRRQRRTGKGQQQPGTAEAKLLEGVRLDILGRLIPHIAHDLNQPAGIARMAAETSLLDVEAGDTDPSSLRRCLTTISDQMERIADLAAFAGALSRDDAGTDRDFDAGAVVAMATERIMPFMRSLNFGLEVSLPDEGVMVRGSTTRFQMAILAILLAAWDYLATARGTNSEDRSDDPILVHGECHDGMFDLEIVCDTGCASEAGDNRALLASSRPMLAVRLIADHMGGRFKLRAHANGLHAHLSLPFMAAAAAPPPEPGKTERAAVHLPAGEAAVARAKNADGNLSILLVDDEELALEGILAHLSRLGHAVTTARNGKEALEHFVADKPDVVVTDLRMPVMSGNVLIRKLRALDTDVPIIVMTGHALPQDEEQATTDGASTVLRKPVRLRELTTIINNVPKRRGNAGADDPY